MAIVLLTLVTLTYAGYNLFVKASGSHMPAEATTTILATLCLQAGAVTTATAFLVYLNLQGGHTFKLSQPAYIYAVAAGVCIGAAEVCYFYIFGGVGGIKPLPANIVIPTVVTGTIVITLIVSFFIFKERLTMMQMIGTAMIVGGIVVMFAEYRGSGHV
ncbi:MAG: EamA family transporter [Rhodospirillales bacterium]|nr:EamA family transporter [Rhodospirillales bacterium]